MSAPKNYTGTIGLSVLIPPARSQGKWTRRGTVARYAKGRLMGLRGKDFPKPPDGEGFTGEFTIAAVVMRPMPGTRGSVPGKVSAVTFTVEDGHVTREKEHDIPLAKTEGITF